jgi:hypothetical protein
MTATIAQQQADKFISDLHSWGLINYTSSGKYRPSTKKVCGTCISFSTVTDMGGSGHCLKTEAKFHISDSCHYHSYNKLMVELIVSGLPTI